MDQAAITKEAAILSALSARALIERQHLLTAELTVFMKAAIDSTTDAATALASTDVNTKRLADWTRGVVFATWALGAAAIFAAFIGLVWGLDRGTFSHHGFSSILAADCRHACASHLAAASRGSVALISPQAEHLVATNSGHYIQNDDPPLVIDAIRRVVAQGAP
jgi:hypothetical protein